MDELKLKLIQMILDNDEMDSLSSIKEFLDDQELKMVLPNNVIADEREMTGGVMTGGGLDVNSLEYKEALNKFGNKENLEDGRMAWPTDTNSDSYKVALKMLLRNRENMDYDEGINAIKAVIGAAKQWGWDIAVEEGVDDFEGITIGTEAYLLRNLKGK